MGDIGDYWNEHKAFKRAARSQWVECSSPGCQFGGNPVKVPPGAKCRHCGVLAPGCVGEDVRFARRDEADREAEQIHEEAERKRKLLLRTCRACGRKFTSEQGRADHERNKHGRAAVKAIGFAHSD